MLIHNPLCCHYTTRAISLAWLRSFDSPLFISLSLFEIILGKPCKLAPLLQEICTERLTSKRKSDLIPSNLDIKQLRAACDSTEENALDIRILMNRQLLNISFQKGYCMYLFPKQPVKCPFIAFENLNHMLHISMAVFASSSARSLISSKTCIFSV